MQPAITNHLWQKFRETLMSVISGPQITDAPKTSKTLRKVSSVDTSAESGISISPDLAAEKTKRSLLLNADDLQQAIRQAAYYKSQARAQAGQNPDPQYDWIEAEAELLSK